MLLPECGEPSAFRDRRQFRRCILQPMLGIAGITALTGDREYEGTGPGCSGPAGRSHES